VNRSAAIVFVLVCSMVLVYGAPQSAVPDMFLFFESAVPDESRSGDALDQIAAAWKDSYTPILVDFARLMEGPRPGNPGSPIRQRLVDFLEKQTGQEFGQNLDQWRLWMWKLPYDPHPNYAPFKGALYGQIDPLMMEFFPVGTKATIRMDEVDWGGVRVNDIPPLDHPTFIESSEADYLDDDHIVFGISVNGEARAYPKRILAWHEMALDEIGGVELTIIYCTLCGTVLPYESEIGGKMRKFGTSGFLYRSNKLFFDEATKRLWSTLEGKPVVGKLIDQDLELKLRSSVTTTWKEWKKQNPNTTVLSIDTGYDRDYDEGVAYKSYFDSDRLMFEVPETDDRLNNEDDVLVMLIDPSSGAGREPVALSTDFLEKNRIYPFEAGGRSFVVITSEEGANRVFETGDVRFGRERRSNRIEDEERRRWRVTEDALVAEGAAVELSRVTANRAFWFGWYAQFPNTRLVK
jgi:hypothetical protein